MLIIKKQKHVAFTLSEVLIIIAIIGVIASLTIITLNAKIQKFVLKNQIKKNYSYLSQTMQKVMFEIGDNTPENTGGFGWKDINDAIIKNLKIIKICEGNALKSHCIPEYQGLNISQCSGFNENNIYNFSTIYILADGSFLIPYNHDWRSLWLVDVNGMKGPNKASYDLFDVAFDTKDKKLEYRGYGCLNQDKSIKGGLDNFKNLDKW